MSKKCIFCGGGGKKSKEHIWPVWMHEYLPLRGDGNHITGLDTYQWQDQTDTFRKKRQGHLVTKKLRVVCGACNSGWMSRLESQVKPILKKILTNQVLEISRVDQVTLANWITTKAIVGEHSEPDTYMTPFDDRNNFMLKGDVPNYFCIYIGFHKEAHDTGWLRTSQTIALSKEGPKPPLGNRKRNCQSIGMLFGPLFVCVFAIRHDNIDTSKFFSFTKLLKLYPYSEGTLHWPPKDVLSSLDMQKVVYAMDDLKKQPNVSYGGELPQSTNT